MTERTSTRIRKAAVLGAGVMGSGIAAHLASCGIKCLLMDIVPPNLSDEEKGDPAARNRFAQNGLDGALKARPALFVKKEAKSLIEIGNFEDDLHRISECDWVIEVIIEDMGIKQKFFADLEKHWKAPTIVSSNTSGLSIAGMLEGRSQEFKQHFLGTHFFNPVRYMHLLEIIRGPDTSDEVMDEITFFVRRFLGKGVVDAKDTTNFIANRIGVYAMMTTINGMQELGYTIEEVDTIAGKPMGRPSSAAFRTADMVGLDTFIHVTQNCYDTLTHDPQRETFKVPEFLRKMVEKGLLGGKTKQGFYKKVKKDISVIDIETLEYKPKNKPDMPEVKKVKKIGDPGKRMKALIDGGGRGGEFAWYVTARTLAYAANIAWEIGDDVVNIDRAMRWGFNWEQGPFEGWQSLGIKETADKIRAEGLELPAWIDDAIEKGGFYVENDGQEQCYAAGEKLIDAPQIPGALSLAKIKASKGVVEKNRGATLIDLGDGIACVEFHTKMNIVDADLVTMLNTACDVVMRDFDGLVLANEAEHFSAGANLMLVGMYAKQEKWDDLEAMIKAFQDTNQRLTYLPRPVVANPHGLVLGGGCEMAMAADRMMVSQETYMGLVEVGVGLIPGGNGHLNMLKRVLAGIPASSTADRLPFIQRAFENIGLAKVATGGGEVFELGFARAQDMITHNRDTRINDAKRLCRFMADAGYTPPPPADNLVLPGKNGAAAVSLFVYGMMLSGWASEHDRLLADKIGYILCGGETNGRSPVDEQYILDLEREAFLSMCGEEKTHARIEHMLTKNKPLRN